MPLPSYPVPKEVGKVGTNSSTYVEPVSERKDGIASFFKRQEEKSQGPSKSPAKMKYEASSAKLDDPVHSPVKTGIKDVKGVEGLGDDSNAPQVPRPTVIKGKLKATEEVKEEAKEEGADHHPVRQSKRLRSATQDKKPVKIESESDDDIEILDEADFKKRKTTQSASKVGNGAKPGVCHLFLQTMARLILRQPQTDSQQTSLDTFLEK